MKAFLYSDGGARGNPGPAAGGAVIKNEKGIVLAAFGKYFGETTNNQAEYQALIMGLEKAKELGVTELSCLADSELMVKQLKREYRVRDSGLGPLFLKAYNLSSGFKKITYNHIRREKNKEADLLVNETLDRLA